METSKEVMIKTKQDQIQKLEEHIAKNKDKINDVDSPEWLRKLLIDDNNIYQEQIKQLQEELETWKK